MHIQKGVYRHYKGKEYAVLGMALKKGTHDEFVLYKPLYNCEYEYFLRTATEFSASVVIEGRKIPKFTYTSPYSEPD